MAVFEEPITMVVAGIILSIAFFVIQLFLCFKARKASTKRIPLYVVLLMVGFILLICTGVLGTGSGVLGNVNLIVASILTVIVAISSLGIAVAWLIYKLKLKQGK